MKKNKLWFVLVGLFCLVTSSATVYATSYQVENEVGVKFFDTTSTTSSTKGSSSSSSSSTIQSSSSLLETSQKKEGFLWLGNNDGGGAGGTMRYYTDDKLLPSTGELVSTTLPFVGVFLTTLVFFYLKKERRKECE